MRQIGILGAAGHFALDNNISRLVEDHRHAKILAEQIHQVAPSVINPDHVQTNIVGLNLKEMNMTAAQLAATAKEKGVLVSALGPRYARLVTHLGVNDSEISKAAEILAGILKGGAS